MVIAVWPMGYRLMAKDGKVRAIDIGHAWWQDVDTAEMYAQAEAHFREVAGSQVRPVVWSSPGGP